MANNIKKEIYVVGIAEADVSASDYVSEHEGRNIAGFIIDSTDAPATLKITDALGSTTQLAYDAGYHPISLTKIHNDGSNSITTVKVFY